MDNNAAAFIEVDNSEIQIKKACYKFRCSSVVSYTVSEHGGKLLHISTDFVFDGQKRNLIFHRYLPSN